MSCDAARMCLPFFVPSSLLAVVLSSLLSKGRHERSSLGLSGLPFFFDVIVPRLPHDSNAPERLSESH